MWRHLVYKEVIIVILLLRSLSSLSLSLTLKYYNEFLFILKYITNLFKNKKIIHFI